MADEGLRIVNTVDNSQLERELKKSREAIKHSADTAVEEGARIDAAFSRIARSAAGLAAGFEIKQFIQKVVQVRGEFQQLEVAFNTMLGSAEKADALMQQLTKTAASTPFDLKGVTDGAKQLLAYGVAAEDVNDTLIHLGDIAAGLSLPLGDLVYLYGTTLTQGRMFTQDLRQFMGRGIPIAEELAKQFGVTKDKVQELVSTGKVGAEEFKKAIMSMSSEGGKFGGLMEAQSKTIIGQISNIEDAIDVMFNNIGKQNEGIINGTLSVVSSLVENYERVGKVIAGVVATYGVYKAAVMTATAMQALQTAGVGALTTAETVHYGWLVLCEKAQKLLNATMLANPYVLVATAVAGLVAVMMTMKTQQDLVNEATEEYNKKKEEAIAKEEEHKRKVEELIQIAGNESLSTDTRREAMLKLKKEYPDLFKKYKTEIEALKEIAYLKGRIAEIESGKSLTNPINELEIANKRIAELEKKGKARYKTITNAQGVSFSTQIGGRTQKEEAELLSLMQTRDKLTKDIRKKKTDNYFENLTGVSNEDLEAQLKERRDLLARINMAEQDAKKDAKKDVKVKGKVKNGEARGIYSKEEIEDQITSLEWEINRRNQVIEDGAKNFATEAQKAYKIELAALEKLRSLNDPKKRAASKMTVEVGGKMVKASELSADQLQEAIKKQEQKVKEAEKKANDLAGKSSRNAGKEAGRQKKERERNEKEYQQRREDLAKMREALEERLSQSFINIEEDASARELAQLQHDHEVEMAEFERQKQEYIKKKIELEKAKAKASGKEYTTPMDSNDVLDTEELQRFDRLKSNIAQRQAKEVEDFYKKEMLAFNDFIREYGSLQEQKAAIAREYEQKIADETDVIRQASLKKERDRIIQELNMKLLRKSIDWEAIFGDLSRLSTDYLKELRGKLREVLNNEDLDPENVKVLSEKILEIENKISEKTDFWSSLIPALRQRVMLTNEVAETEERIKAIREKATKLKDSAITQVADITNSGEGGIRQVWESLGDSPKDILAYFGIDGTTDAGKKLTATLIELSEATEEATDAEKHKSNINKMLKGGSVEDIFSNAVDAAGGGVAGIISLIATNAQSMKETVDKIGLENTDFGQAVHGFSEGVGGFQNAIQSLANGDVFGAVNGVLDGIAGFGKMGINAIVGRGNEDEKEAENAELTKSQNRLIDAINGLAEKIMKSDATNKESIDYYKRAYTSEQEWEEKQRQKIDNRASEYANSGYGFLGLGGKSSFNAHMAGNDWSGWDVFSQILREHKGDTGVSHGSVNRNNLWDLSPEEMKLLSEFAPKEWEALFNGDGHRNPSDLVDEYIERAGELERLTSALNEKLTGYSWDSFLDSYKSLLKDMTSQTEDFGDKMEEIISNALIESLVNDEFRERIQELYKYIADHAGDGLDNGELDFIRKENEKIANDMIARRQNLIDAGLLKLSDEEYKQTSSVKGFQAMSQDTGEELNGRFTAIQVGLYDIRDLAAQVKDIVVRMEQGQGGINTRIEAIQTAIATSNVYLSAISKNTKKVLDFGDILEEIRDNLKNL